MTNPDKLDSIFDTLQLNINGAVHFTMGDELNMMQIINASKEAKSEILAWIDEAIGEDEIIITTLSPNKTSASYRNKFRAELRRKLGL